VPEATRHRATRHLVDWLGCAAAGAATSAGAAFRAAGEVGDITVMGQDAKLTPRSAAFTMGAFGNPLEMDDLDRAAILHPGPVIMPAALAAAQISDTSPDHLLDGIVRGYDAMIRLGRTVGPGHYAKFHNTATCGPLGAAVASAHILRLDAEQTLWAMGNALTQAAGFWACRHEDVMTKQLHTARAAESGLAAALLAGSDVSGPRRILEGPQGFYEGMCPDPAPEWLLAEPEAWRIHEVSFKPWPACRHCHPAIDAAIVLRGKIDQLDSITKGRIDVYRDAAIFCDKPDPQTTIDAKFSLQHAVGVTLADGPPGLDAFDAEARKRDDVAGFRRCIDVVVDPDLNAAYPAHFGARLTLQLADGSELSELRTDAAGDPELPMDDEHLIAKAMSLMAWGGVRLAAAQELIDMTLHLTSASDLAPFLGALRRAGADD
jgi:2-methylcitrate dehydratase PrpD